jgi:hypothetical protein
MSKIGLKSLNFLEFMRPINFKKEILLFDSLWIDTDYLKLNYNMVEQVTRNAGGHEFKVNFDNNLRNIEYLATLGLLNLVTTKIEEKNDLLNSDEIELYKLIQSHHADMKYVSSFKNKVVNKKGTGKFVDLLLNYPDKKIRLNAILLSRQEPEKNFIPILSSLESYNNGMESIYRFILNKIPEPKDSVSWEQILDFKEDPDTMRKYYALINWLNEVANSDMTASQIADRFEYLYHEYCEQYRIHKVEFTMSTLENLFVLSVDAFTKLQLPGLGGVFSSFYKIKKETLSLLKAELSFTGKEVAYIHKLKNQETFK